MTACGANLLLMTLPAPGAPIAPGGAIAQTGFLDFLAAALDGVKPDVPAEAGVGDTGRRRASRDARQPGEEEPAAPPPLACAIVPAALIDPQPALERESSSVLGWTEHLSEPAIPLRLAPVSGAQSKDAAGPETLEHGNRQEENRPSPVLQPAPVAAPIELPKLSPLREQESPVDGERHSAPPPASGERVKREAGPEPGVRREPAAPRSAAAAESPDPVAAEPAPMAFRARLVPKGIEPGETQALPPARRAGAEAPPIRQPFTGSPAQEIPAFRSSALEQLPDSSRSLTVNPATTHLEEPAGNVPPPLATPANPSPRAAPRFDGHRGPARPEAAPADETETAVPERVSRPGNVEPGKSPARDSDQLPASEPVRGNRPFRSAEPAILPFTGAPRSPAAGLDKVTDKPSDNPAEPLRLPEEPAAVRRTPVAREVTLRIPVPGTERVEVRVQDRAGEVHVAVRTRDAELAKSLRADLPELVGSLERRGFHAETWRPPGGEQIGPAAHRDGRSLTPDLPADLTREGGPGSGHGDGHGRQGQQHQRRRGEPETRFEIPAILNEQEKQA